ncbi:MAG TPA: glycosyltransferase [Thermoanaerobaculia bacterium]|nr:glycosyltransferase [Thermoanaerobaculia bacterium]
MHGDATGKRIILTTHGTLGDVHPYLALALELQRRGHRPVIATSEYYRPRIESEGVAFHPIRPDVAFDDRELHRRLTEPKRGFERVIREVMMPVLRGMYDDLLAAVQSDGGAALIVSQVLVFAAPLVAEKTSVRWVSTELQPGIFLSAHDPPMLAAFPALAKLRGLGPTFHRALFRVARLTARSWSAPVHELRRELGLAPGKDPLFEGRTSPELVLAMFSSLIGPPQSDWPPNTLVTGFPFFDEDGMTVPPELERFLDDGEPPIVFTLGTSAVWTAGDFYRESVAAAQKLGKRAVLLVGHDPRNRIGEPLPKTTIAIPYAPYARVFPRASVIVHQGGIGTTAQALRAGKPMLVLPFGGDQYDNGARIERLGIGRTVRQHRYARDRVAALLQELLDRPGYSEQAAKARTRVLAEDGVRTACDAIEARL